MAPSRSDVPSLCGTTDGSGVSRGKTMKELILVGGPMGVGKTSTCRELLHRLSPSAFLDGDWCWTMSPFVVNGETKNMVLDNIGHILNNFLRCSAYRYVIFCWVMHSQSIVDDILRRLDLTDTRTTLFTLTASEQVLRARLQHDIDEGTRSPGVIERSLERLPRYAAMKSVNIDVSDITPALAAARMEAFLKEPESS